MTNGGGVTEAERCDKLTRQLGVTVSALHGCLVFSTDLMRKDIVCLQIRPSQLVQAHTVLRGMKDKYADVPVLVLGGRGNKGREVAER